MINIFTVDVEDWQQSTLDYNLPISDSVLHNTVRLLKIMAEFNVRGTFFVQSLAADRYPDLIYRIATEGHEIASHGHSHIPLFRLTPADFAEDLRRSLEILTDLSAHPVQGYRAPDFSIRGDTLWALDILRRQGLRYSSSIYPFRGHRYGIPRVALHPHEIVDGLVEVPLSVVRLAGYNWPVAGGGYLRVMPYSMTRWAIRRINAEGRAAVVYVHPYELDASAMREFRGRIPWHLYWSQSLNRQRTESKIRSLFQDFKFAPICEVVTL